MEFFVTIRDLYVYRIGESLDFGLRNFRRRRTSRAIKFSSRFVICGWYMDGYLDLVSV